jgi:hypothetical protein
MTTDTTRKLYKARLKHESGYEETRYVAAEYVTLATQALDVLPWTVIAIEVMAQGEPLVVVTSAPLGAR